MSIKREELKKLVLDTGLSREQIAKAVGVSNRASIDRWFVTGKMRSSYYEKLVALGKTRLNERDSADDDNIISTLEPVSKLVSQPIRRRPEDHNDVKPSFLEMPFESILNLNGLIVIGGRPGLGKTSLGINLALTLFEKNKKAVGAWFSVELQKDQTVLRLLSASSGIPAKFIQSGKLSDGDYQKLITASQMISKSHLFVDDSPQTSIAELVEKCRCLYEREGRLDFICIDFIQLISPNPDISSAAEIFRLVNFSRKYGTTIIVLSQLSKSVDLPERAGPRSADILEPWNCLEFVAEHIFLIGDSKDTKVPQAAQSSAHRRMDLMVAKSNFLPPAHIQLQLNSKTGRIRISEERSTNESN